MCVLCSCSYRDNPGHSVLLQNLREEKRKNLQCLFFKQVYLTSNATALYQKWCFALLTWPINQGRNTRLTWSWGTFSSLSDKALHDKALSISALDELSGPREIFHSGWGYQRRQSPAFSKHVADTCRSLTLLSARAHTHTHGCFIYSLALSLSETDSYHLNEAKLFPYL